MKISHVGIPWYRREDYQRLIEIFEDGEAFSNSFDGWLEAAEQFERNAKKNGIVPVRALIDPDEFPVWCRANNLRVDGEGRKRFASETAHQIARA